MPSDRVSPCRAVSTNGTVYLLATLLLPGLLLAQKPAAAPQSAVAPFPAPDFALRDKDSKPVQGAVVLGSIGSDGKAQASSLSFSGDGRILAVGSTLGRVDLWDVESRKKLRTIEGGSRAGLSRDGRLLAKDGKDGSSVELYEVASGKLLRSIPRAFKRAENTIQALVFSPDGTLLDIAANAEDDEVYEVSSGKLLATLKDTRHAQFSKDGSLLIGASRQHLLVWSTKRWTKVRDLPNGPDDVTQIAAFPERDFVVIGGLTSARLVRLSAGQEFATLGAGYTSFAAFNPSGESILTYANSGFAVWDATGRRYCSRPDLGDGAAALSANGRWLAAAPRSGGTAVAVWNVQSALAECGAAPKP